MKRILVADDEKDALEILAKRLTREGYQVSAAASGAEVLKAVRGETPDLFLLDIVMEDMDGYTLAALLRKEERLRDVPIIFITGKELVPQGIEIRMAELGVSGYIFKPCSFEEIAERVRQVVGE